MAVLAANYLCAATLEKLSLDEMIQKSTSIVRARVTSCAGRQHGAVIYTHCGLTVSETLKGSRAASVATPGGSAGGLSQIFSGAPQLKEGEEYVLFLWAGRSGLAQVLGLSQGVFQIEAGSGGPKTARREASGERMLDAAGNPVEDEARVLKLDDLRRRIARLSGAAQ